jgi:ABC-type cobalamin/Fe3+-siderophores transport system ATPase subunit
MEFLERLNRHHGVTIVMAIHDLQQATWGRPIGSSSCGKDA